MFVHLRLVDKFVISFLVLVLVLRAPYLFIPLVIIVYMIYVLGRAAKRRSEHNAEKAKKNATKTRIEALENEVAFLKEQLALSQKPKDDKPSES